MRQTLDTGERFGSIFGFDDSTKAGGVNGYKEDKIDEESEELLTRSEAKEYRRLAARCNFMSLDCLDHQFPIKKSSRSVAHPTRSSWSHLKKVARYLIGVETIVWRFGFQEEPKYCRVYTDSDWGGHVKDKRSTSGG
eukprot:8758057-Karenia_brevis.AAC.1